MTIPNYPMGILRGCAAVDEAAIFAAMPDGFFRPVMRLVKKINLAAPRSPIFARRDTLARESGKSVETVGRALRWLEESGLIYREQKTRRGLKGSDTHIHPTPSLLAALGINEAGTAAKPKEGRGAQPTDGQFAPPVKTDDSISAPRKPKELQSLRRQSSAEVRKPANLSTPTETNPGRDRAVVKLQGRSIPRDLAWLVTSERLTAVAILSLMKAAKEAGKRLSDIVAVTRQYLEKLKDRALFAYIRQLISQDKDFSFIHKRDTDATEKAAQTQRDSELIARKALEWHGRVFEDKNGSRIEIISSGFYNITQNGSTRSGRIDRALVDAVLEGRLRPARTESSDDYI